MEALYACVVLAGSEARMEPVKFVISASMPLPIQPVALIAPLVCMPHLVLGALTAVELETGHVRCAFLVASVSQEPSETVLPTAIVLQGLQLL